MPSCVARGCSSRYERGDPYGRLKLFPRKDLKRRQIWIERVNRSDWAPTKFSGLCDVSCQNEPQYIDRRKRRLQFIDFVICVKRSPEVGSQEDSEIIEFQEKL